MSTLEPRQAEIFESFAEKLQRRIHTHLCGKVVSYDSNERLATVRPLQEHPLEDRLDDFVGIPVIWSSTGRWASEGGLQVGDPGLILFHELDPSEVYRLGGEAAVKNLRRHGYYAEFLPRAVTPYARGPALGPNEWVIGSVDGEVQLVLSTDGTVTIKASTIKLGSDAPGDAVALASIVDQHFTAIKTAIASGFTAVGVGAAANGPSGATAFNGAFNPTPTASDVTLTD
jgi:hypothetical protein